MDVVLASSAASGREAAQRLPGTSATSPSSLAFTVLIPLGRSGIAAESRRADQLPGAPNHMGVWATRRSR
jgi:hypothetical protein